MPQNRKVDLYAADETARLFVLFQQHFDVFQILLSSGVFEQTNGSVTLHFDHEGLLRTVQRADVLYSRKHDPR